MIFLMLLAAPPTTVNTDDKISGKTIDYARNGAIVVFKKEKFDEVKKLAEELNFKLELVHEKLPGIAKLKAKKPFECVMEFKVALSKLASSKHIELITPNSKLENLKGVKPKD